MMTAEALGMDVLVEVHDKAELERALSIRPKLIGVNNRNLQTLEVDLATGRDLVRHIPPGIFPVSESGIARRADLDHLRESGFRAFLVGETLMRDPDPGEALRSLV